MAAALVWLALNTLLFLTVTPASIAYTLPGQVGQWYWRDLAAPILAMVSACAVMKAISGFVSMGVGPGILHIGCAAMATALAGCLTIPIARRTLRELLSRIRRTIGAVIMQPAARN
jgi:hypothetical protein